MKMSLRVIFAVFFSFFATINTYARDNDDDPPSYGEAVGEGKVQQPVILTYDNMEEILFEHLDENPELFNTSGKDIVVFIGKTGSGKSTLINFLSGRDLVVNEDGEIELKKDKDKKDPLAMEIGDGPESCTRLPKTVDINGLLFYDLPGLGDTGGVSGRDKTNEALKKTSGALYDLINAFFMKRIIEQAGSVKLVAVASIHDALSGRGDPLKKLAKGMKGLLPNNKNIGRCSSCIITMSDRSEDRLIPYLERKVDKENLSLWVKDPKYRIAQMSKGKLELKEKESIMATILGEEEEPPIPPVPPINPPTPIVSEVLEGLIMRQILPPLHGLTVKIRGKISKYAALGTLTDSLRAGKATIKLGKTRRNFLEGRAFQKKLREEVESSSKLLTLLKSLDKSVYQEAYQNADRFLNSFIEAKKNLLMFECIQKEAERDKQIALLCATPIVSAPVALPVAYHFKCVEEGSAKEVANAEEEVANAAKVIARRMLRDSTDIKTISEQTGLSEEDIQALES